VSRRPAEPTGSFAQRDDDNDDDQQNFHFGHLLTQKKIKPQKPQTTATKQPRSTPKKQNTKTSS
jgi:hypothetical protein